MVKSYKYVAIAVVQTLLTQRLCSSGHSLGVVSQLIRKTRKIPYTECLLKNADGTKDKPKPRSNFRAEV